MLETYFTCNIMMVTNPASFQIQQVFICDRNHPTIFHIR